VLPETAWAASPRGAEILNRLLTVIQADPLVAEEVVDDIVKYVLPKPAWAANPKAAEILKHIVENKLYDANAIMKVMSRAEWAAKPEAVDLMKTILSNYVAKDSRSFPTFFIAALATPAWAANPRSVEILLLAEKIGFLSAEGIEDFLARDSWIGRAAEVQKARRVERGSWGVGGCFDWFIGLVRSK
jgi:hypothetical protein